MLEGSRGSVTLLYVLCEKAAVSQQTNTVEWPVSCCYPWLTQQPSRYIPSNFLATLRASVALWLDETCWCTFSEKLWSHTGFGTKLDGNYILSKHTCGCRHKKNKFREQVAQGWMSSAMVHKYIVVGLHRLLTQSKFLDDMTCSFCRMRCECFKAFQMRWHWLPARPKDSKWLNFEGCANCTHLYVTELWQMWMFSGLPVTLITVPKGALGRQLS